mgnify:CR=1 FL=1
MAAERREGRGAAGGRGFVSLGAPKVSWLMREHLLKGQSGGGRRCAAAVASSRDGHAPPAPSLIFVAHQGRLQTVRPTPREPPLAQKGERSLPARRLRCPLAFSRRSLTSQMLSYVRAGECGHRAQRHWRRRRRRRLGRQPRTRKQRARRACIRAWPRPLARGEGWLGARQASGGAFGLGAATGAEPARVPVARRRRLGASAAAAAAAAAPAAPA